MSTRLRYIGDQHSGLDVRVGDAYEHVKHRGEIELPYEVARNLLSHQSGLWEEVKPKGQKDEDA